MGTAGKPTRGNFIALRATDRELGILNAWRDRVTTADNQPSLADAMRAAIKALEQVERDRARKRRGADDAEQPD